MADYKRAKRRLLVLGYNATLTTAVEAPRQPHHHFDQIQVTCSVWNVLACCKPYARPCLFAGAVR